MADAEADVRIRIELMNRSSLSQEQIVIYNEWIYDRVTEEMQGMRTFIAQWRRECIAA